jgi:hypothetical protein
MLAMSADMRVYAGGCRGFCRHKTQDFAGWHRPFMHQFEKGLMKAARVATRRFTNATMKEDFRKVAATIRAPYYDWYVFQTMQSRLHHHTFVTPVDSSDLLGW